jgi:hypothetical protein
LEIVKLFSNYYGSLFSKVYGGSVGCCGSLMAYGGGGSSVSCGSDVSLIFELIFEILTQSEWKLISSSTYTKKN